MRSMPYCIRHLQGLPLSHMGQESDAVVIGSGPNGLMAAIVLAQAGLAVELIESRETLGGGMRSAPLTLPGFLHDMCSAVHPLALSSPCFRDYPLMQNGLEWIQPEIPLAHPFDDGTAVFLARSIQETSAALSIDGAAYSKLIEPLAASWMEWQSDVLAPLHFPRHPFHFLRFALLGGRSASGFAESRFRGERARALFAGMAAHSLMPLEQPLTAAFGLILGVLGHVVGWPIAKGGSQRIADALEACFLALGGHVTTGRHIACVEELPQAKAFLFDVGPRALVKIVGEAFPFSYRRKLERYRYGPGVFKMDWALSQPIPWKAAECARAGTVHLGGTMEEIAHYEREVAAGRTTERPYVLVVQPTLFDSTRAPPGRHIAWAYCHVPYGSALDFSAAIEGQIERFAPGFRDCILAKHVCSAVEMEGYNPNYVGGDISGGVQDIWQLFARPVMRWVPYATPIRGVYICSSSTPPGGGVHGLCGYYAAHAAIAKL